MSSRPVLTVSQLTAEIKTLLERSFEHLWVEGEISNLRQPGSGHFYFTLKDAAAQVRAVMFRGQNRLLRFRPEDGLQVVGYGRLTLYEPRGEYQIVLEHLEPKGLGALQLAFEQLKEKLAAEGLFDPARKRPLPALPRKIGVVTSPTGAAIRDILQILGRRFANVHVLIFPVRVQGAGAAQEIARAVEELGRWPGLEVMIVGRGGGSLEDLWAFNEEAVARAIAASPVPVISAVGHEVDFTIADFVADLRAPTPSAAAELVVGNKAELVRNLEGLHLRLAQSFRLALEAMGERVSSLASRLADPRRRVADLRLRLDDLFARLAGSARQGLRRGGERLGMRSESLWRLHPGRRVAEFSLRLIQLHRRLALAGRSGVRFCRQRTEVLGGRLHSLSPLSVLERGYSIARLLPSGEIVREASRLKAGDRVAVKVRRGEFSARVEKVEEESGQDPQPSLTLGPKAV